MIETITDSYIGLFFPRGPLASLVPVSETHIVMLQPIVCGRYLFRAFFFYFRTQFLIRAPDLSLLLAQQPNKSGRLTCGTQIVVIIIVLIAFVMGDMSMLCFSGMRASG